MVAPASGTITPSRVRVRSVRSKPMAVAVVELRRSKNTSWAESSDVEEGEGTILKSAASSWRLTVHATLVGTVRRLPPVSVMPVPAAFSVRR